MSPPYDGHEPDTRSEFAQRFDGDLGLGPGITLVWTREKSKGLVEEDGAIKGDNRRTFVARVGPGREYRIEPIPTTRPGSTLSSRYVLIYPEKSGRKPKPVLTVAEAKSYAQKHVLRPRPTLDRARKLVERKATRSTATATEIHRSLRSHELEVLPARSTVDAWIAEARHPERRESSTEGSRDA